MTRVAILMDMPLYPYRIYAYNELARRGYELTVVSVSKKTEKFGIPLMFEHRVYGRKKVGPFVRLQRFNRSDYDQYDTIIVDPNLRMLNYYGFYGKKYRQKLIVWGHLTGRTSGNKVAEWVRYNFFKKFRAMVFYDTCTRDEYIAHGFDARRLFVANNTQYVDKAIVRPNEERRYFLYVGRIQERKGLELALRAFAKVKTAANEERLQFVIIGGGDAERLNKLCEDLSISESARFVGPVHDQSELGEWFSHAIAYVSPGHVGLGVLHSFACGVPVITCMGRLHSVEVSNCTDDNSLLVPYTVDGVARAMQTLINNKELQQSLSANAFRYYWEYCTIDRMVDGIEDAIKWISEKECEYKGKLLYINASQDGIVQRKSSIISVNLDTDEETLIDSFPLCTVDLLCSVNRLIVRLKRMEVKSVGRMKDDQLILCAYGRLWLLDIGRCKLTEITKLPKGNSVLNFCEGKDGLFYGDYSSNPSHKAVNIYHLVADGTSHVAYQFPQGSVRHIHNIIRTDEGYLVLAGDNEAHAGIYRANADWSEVRPWKCGEQKYRAVVGFSHKGGLLYATDSVETENQLRYIAADGTEQDLTAMKGSCIYGGETKDYYIFSTAVESPEGMGRLGLLSTELGGGIKDRFAHLITVRKQDLRIEEVIMQKKDGWPMKLMQYGTFMLPKGQEQDNNLWYYTMGCDGDGRTRHIQLKSK